MSQARKILIVEDDQDLIATLSEQLVLDDEFATVSVASVAAALEIVRSQRPELVIMNVAMPDMDGKEAVRIMRTEGFNSPIIMLSGQASDADIVLSLEAGANDCVSKPFRFAVLLARIRAHLRQHQSTDEALLQIGAYTFRPSAKHLTSEDGETLRLTEKETAILRFLHRAGNRVVARDVLLREVWGYNSNVTTHTLETHIYRLRQKIEADPTNAQLLVTEMGGYRLMV